jgi:hypothetical protein
MSITPAFVIYANNNSGDPSLIPLYRYISGDVSTHNAGWVDSSSNDVINNVPILSTIPPYSNAKLNQPDPNINLHVMRYQPDTAGAAPLGYIRRLDAKLDGNQRWISGIAQNLCYGISQFQTSCPLVSNEPKLNWSLINLRSQAIIAKGNNVTNSGEISLTAQTISSLIQPGDSAPAKSNYPLLLQVTNASNGQLLAAKNIRIIRTPWIAQYGGYVDWDDRGNSSAFPTQASAYLMANQLTAHPLFTDPLKARTIDPALFDGITSVAFFDHNLMYNPPASDVRFTYEQQSFSEMDGQGVLTSAEIAPQPWGPSNIPFPMNYDDQITSGSATYNSAVAEFFDISTGAIVPYGTTVNYPYLPPYSAAGSVPTNTQVNTGFVLDLTNTAAVNWLTSGAESWLANQYKYHIHPSFVTLSENYWEGNGAILRPTSSSPEVTDNNNHENYSFSPTFSQSSYQSFHAWLLGLKSKQSIAPSSFVVPNYTSPLYAMSTNSEAIVPAPPANFLALPVLPADYQKAVQHYCPSLRNMTVTATLNSEQQKQCDATITRLQWADPASSLWWYWLIWRREVYANGVSQMALALKKVQKSQAYFRAPLQLVMYQYMGWAAIGGVKFDSSTGMDWLYGDSYDATAGFLYVDPGQDFYTTSQQNPGAFDYFIFEDKGEPDSIAASEAQRMVAFKTQLKNQKVTPKIGLHSDINDPYWQNGSNYMNINLAQVYPNFPNAAFQVPAFDAVWTWEAQCEYVASMKMPDGPVEDLSMTAWVTPNTSSGAAGYGSYTALYSAYSSIISNYCLNLHQFVDLGEGGSATCTMETATGPTQVNCCATYGTQCTSEWNPMNYINDNMSRILKGRYLYTSGQ